jgi:hypothetical protein
MMLSFSAFKIHVNGLAAGLDNTALRNLLPRILHELGNGLQLGVREGLQLSHGCRCHRAIVAQMTRVRRLANHSSSMQMTTSTKSA